MKEELLAHYIGANKEGRLAILRSIEGKRDEDIASFLIEAYEKEEEKELLKTIRRLIFKLKSSGIKVNEPKQKGTPVLRRGGERETLSNGYLCSYDLDLTRMCLITVSLKKPTLFVIHARMNLYEGLTDLEMGETKKDEYLSWLTERMRALDSIDIIVSQISPAYALYLLEEAQRDSQKYKEEVQSLRTLVSRTLSKDGPSSPSDIYTLLEDGKEGSFEGLLSHRIFKNLFLRWEGMEKDIEDYKNIGESTIVLPEYIKKQKRTEFLKEISQTRRFDATLQKVRRILEDYAYMLHNTGDSDNSKRIIWTLKSKELFMELVVILMEKSIVWLSSQKMDERLILTPQEYMGRFHGKIRP